MYSINIWCAYICIPFYRSEEFPVSFMHAEDIPEECYKYFFFGIFMFLTEFFLYSTASTFSLSLLTPEVVYFWLKSSRFKETSLFCQVSVYKLNKSETTSRRKFYKKNLHTPKEIPLNLKASRISNLMPGLISVCHSLTLLSFFGNLLGFDWIWFRLWRVWV